MVMPIIIGLAGVGKSAVNTELVRKLNIEIISTDDEFRRLRAVGANDNNNPDSVVMNLFIKQVYQDFVLTGKMTPFKFAELQRTCNVDSKDAKGRSGFRDSTVARSFGEDVFRTFEWAMNKWLNENNYFAGKLVDISSSAALYPQNHEIFSRENGYVPVLLEADHDVIVGNLMLGFKRHLDLSKAADEFVPVRGAYDKVARNAYEKAGKSVLDKIHAATSPDRVVDDTDNGLTELERMVSDLPVISFAAAEKALSDLAAKHRSERIEKFREMAAITIDMNRGLGDEMIPALAAQQIISELKLG